jgi:Flp pilus assembly pilin Flp
MTALLKRFLRDESGGGFNQMLLVIGTGLVIVPSVNEIGAKLVVVFDTLAKALR